MNWNLVPRKRRVKLENCPVGLFECRGELCLRTEYGDNEGRIDAYIVSSGEFFWGGASTRQEQRKVLVTPVECVPTGTDEPATVNGSGT